MNEQFINRYTFINRSVDFCKIQIAENRIFFFIPGNGTEYSILAMVKKEGYFQVK
jgi:hypothetical protein